jgi:hypothetical protein
MTALARSASQNLQHIHFPNESPQYRRARNALLELEMELRRQVERVTPQSVAPSSKSSDSYKGRRYPNTDTHSRRRRNHARAAGTRTLRLAVSFLGTPTLHWPL